MKWKIKLKKIQKLNLLPDEHKKIIAQKSDELIDWIDKNPNATSQDIYNKKEELREIIEPMLERAKAQDKLDNYCDEIQLRMNDEDGDLYSKLTDDSKKAIQNEIKDVKEFLKKKIKIQLLQKKI